MLIDVELEKLAMLTISSTIAMIWLRVRRVVLLRCKQLAWMAFLKFDHIDLAEMLGYSDHFLGQLKTALVFAADLGDDGGFSRLNHNSFERSSSISRTAPSPPAWVSM